MCHDGKRPPFSRSYGGILPSSLTTVRSIASVFSTRPPELVWGTGRWELARGFSRQHRIIPFTANGYASGLTHLRHGFAYGAGHTLAPVLPLTGRTTFLRHPIACLLPVRYPALVPPAHPEGITGGVRAVSIAGSGMGVPSRVREYQPVVHRLRLSASP